MEILYEDNHLIIINKQGADIVQGDITGDEPLSEKVKTYIKNRYNKPGNVYLGVVHRIDRPVSGVLMFAKTSKALSRLNKMFRDNEVKKSYWAIVKNRPINGSGTLKHYLVRDNKKNKSFAFDTEVSNSKLAVLSYNLVASSDNFYLLEVDLQTGRHHQIRCQLSKIGCPIKGDLKYGFPRSNTDGSISLHARKLEFIHPVSKENIKVIANPPQGHLWQFFIDTLAG